MGAMSFANVGCPASVSSANSRTNVVAIISRDIRRPAVPHLCWLVIAYSCTAPTSTQHIDIFGVADQDSGRSSRAGTVVGILYLYTRREESSAGCGRAMIALS